jgi:hypothetical protein
MATLDELTPLYLKACEVEGKTDRTVQSYEETLRHFPCQGNRHFDTSSKRRL